MIDALLSRFTFCRDLRTFSAIFFGQNSHLRNITRFLHVCPWFKTTDFLSPHNHASGFWTPCVFLSGLWRWPSRDGKNLQVQPPISLWGFFIKRTFSFLFDSSRFFASPSTILTNTYRESTGAATFLVLFLCLSIKGTFSGRLRSSSESLQLYW